MDRVDVLTSFWLRRSGALQANKYPLEAAAGENLRFSTSTPSTRVYSVHSVHLSARISLKDSGLPSISLENRYTHARTSIISKKPENP